MDMGDGFLALLQAAGMPDEEMSDGGVSASDADEGSYGPGELEARGDSDDDDGDMDDSEQVTVSLLLSVLASLLCFPRA